MAVHFSADSPAPAVQPRRPQPSSAVYGDAKALDRGRGQPNIPVQSRAAGIDMLKHALPLAFAMRPSTVYGILRRRLGQIVPLNTLLGIEIVSIGDGVAEARLPFRREVTNHIGSVHATAIFGLAEAASGGAMSGAFAPVVTEIRPVTANASVTFRKVARSDLIAHAHTSVPSEDLRAQLANNGKTVFDVVVDVQDDARNEIGQVTVAWHVTRK